MTMTTTDITMTVTVTTVLSITALIHSYSFNKHVDRTQHMTSLRKSLKNELHKELAQYWSNKNYL